MSFLRQCAAGAAAVFLIAGAPAFAAEATAPPSPRALALAKRYFADAHMDQTASGMMKSILPAMVEQMAKQHPEMTPEQRQAVVEATNASMAAMMDKMMERMAPIFATTFTEKELQDLVSFIESPTGQAMITKMPVVMGKMTPVMVELMPEMQTDVRQRVCAKIDCSKVASPSPKG
jgi:hypothetical protein